MIVISTHNGAKYLKYLLSDIKSFNIPNDKVCIVDNVSKDLEHLDYLELLKKDGYIILHNPENSYELGAFKYALDNITDDVWFSMQDCFRIKQDIFSYVRPKLTLKNMYTWLTFTPGLYDNFDDRMFLSLHYGVLSYSKGVYASSMFILNEVVQKIKHEWYIPKNKIDAMGSERGVAVIFDKYGIQINGLGLYEPTKSSDPNGYPFFSKIYGGRG
jgi:glycosyltransferase involved in cell wall biosynthesis